MATETKCSGCGSKLDEKAKFCAGCGTKRLGGYTNVSGDAPFLKSSQVSEIVRTLEDSDLGASFSLNLTTFLFIEGRCLNGDFGKLWVDLTNPDHVDLDERLGMMGWQIYEPGDGFDSSYEQGFAWVDTDSKTDTIRKCLQALALVSSSSGDFVSLTFNYQVDAKWRKIRYTIETGSNDRER